MGQAGQTGHGATSWQRYPYLSGTWASGLRLYLNLGERIQENCSFEAVASTWGLRAPGSEQRLWS